MIIDFTDINYLKDPDVSIVKADYEHFLLSLDGLTIIDITGNDTNKCRVIVTLLYGNEPSGVIALHRLYESLQTTKPPTNLRIIICSVEAASLTPLMSHRFLDENKDINCLFGKDSPANEDYISRACLIETKIREVNPEAVIDIRNTPGSNPAFVFSHLVTPEVLTLASLFCSTLILTKPKSGTLLAQNFACPMIRIECGHKKDEQSHEVAFHGLRKFIACKDLSTFPQNQDVNIIYKTLQLKVKPDVEINFGSHDEGESGVTFKENLDMFNYGGAQVGQLLGWLDRKGLDNLELVNEVNENVIDDYFYQRDNQLVVKKAFKLFLAHNDMNLIDRKCLFYVTAI